MGHKVAGTTGLYVHVTRETFDKVDFILDQAFGDALRDRLLPTTREFRVVDATAPRDSQSLRPSRS